MKKFFKLEEYNTTVGKEVLAGVTTFFTMAYILFVNPLVLSDAGLPFNGVYIATIFAAVVGTMIMGVFANLPYAQAPGMGLNAFFAYTVVILNGYTPFEALALVFVCGILNIIITVTSFRKHLIKAIPETLQQAIGAGIGLFIAYIGMLNVNLIEFGAVPTLTNFTNPNVLLALIGLAITIVLMLKNVKGAILIGIILTTIIGIPMGVVDVQASLSSGLSYSAVFKDFGSIFGKALGSEGIVSLFKNHSLTKIIPIVLAFSLTDTFDTIGTFIGTGRRSGIFDEAEQESMETGSGLSSRLERGLFADAFATMAGAVFGTSNVTTFVESSAGIEVGGRTGLTAVVTSGMFLLSILIAPVISLVPSAATAPALIIVGILMSASFADIEWGNFELAIPAFFTVIMTVLSYSISNGIAFGFVAYILVNVVQGKAKEVHPIIYGSAALFVLNFVMIAVEALKAV
ncbi:NCS2 family permease [Erysipelothrix urinaevulpis]|uniref:NCS2 family permease n=1 Tax=Erysipelothrix urinaevulpis TaxID=2683717 RepID=UPI00135A6EB8|nr:NCS2 family permease [Erysipelothrix urinaevulpis]